MHSNYLIFYLIFCSRFYLIFYSRFYSRFYLIFYLFRNFNQISLKNTIIPLDKTTDSLDLEFINKIIALISHFGINFKLIFIYR